jgi:hypothetical protein
VLFILLLAILHFCFGCVFFVMHMDLSCFCFESMDGADMWSVNGVSVVVLCRWASGLRGMLCGPDAVSRGGL